MVYGVVQATLFSSGDASKLKGRPAVPWSLPVFVIPMPSFSYQMAFPPDRFRPAVLQSRIANALGIEDGDDLEFELEGAGSRFKLPVSVSENTRSDFTIENRGLYFVDSAEMGTECMINLSNGRKLSLANQELWAGMKISRQMGGGILHFDGASRDNPGPAGLGFTVYSSVDCENPQPVNFLVRGYQYIGAPVTSNVAEYSGLLEGLEWALRFDFKKIWIQGDSELVLNQVSGQWQVRDAKLKPYHSKITEMLKKAREVGVNIECCHVPRDKNEQSDELANKAIDLKENSTQCDWENINKQCLRTL